MNEITLKIKQITFNFLKKHNLLDDLEKFFIVGFSGGIDSICLLDILHKLSMEYSFKLISAHLNHNWRGEQSKQEEIKAKLFSESKNIPFFSKTLSPELPRTEEFARSERYLFFNQIAAKVPSLTVFTGHTKTDNSETVLYRIIKGAGITGLRGIPEVRFQENNVSIYRPLLKITKEETIQYCVENNIYPTIDSSNLNEKYLRNRIRISLIPALKTYNSCVEESLDRLSYTAKETEEIVEEYLKTLENIVFTKEKFINAQNFVNLSEPVKKRILINFLKYHKLEYDFEKIQEIINFIKESCSLKSGNTLSLNEKTWLFSSKKIIRIIQEIKAQGFPEGILIEFNREILHTGLGIKLIIKEWHGKTPESFPKDSSMEVYADFSNIKENLYLRTRKPGDKIQPFGMKEKIKLKKYFINKGIPEFERDKIPLLTTENEVLWAIGVGISEILRVKNAPSHVIFI